MTPYLEELMLVQQRQRYPWHSGILMLAAPAALVVILVAGAALAGAQAHVRGAAGIVLPGPIAAETPCGSWQVVNSPNPTEDSNYIFGMEVVSPTEIWAVGNYIVNQFPNPGVDKALALRWNGTE